MLKRVETKMKQGFQNVLYFPFLLGDTATSQELRALRLRSQKSFQLTMSFLRQNFYDEQSHEMIELQEELLSSRPCAAAMPQIIGELRSSLQLEKTQRLLDNQVCAVAMFLMMFEALVERQVQLETAILEQPEVWQLLKEEDLEIDSRSPESSDGSSLE